MYDRSVVLQTISSVKLDLVIATQDNDKGLLLINQNKNSTESSGVICSTSKSEASAGVRFLTTLSLSKSRYVRKWKHMVTTGVLLGWSWTVVAVAHRQHELLLTNFELIRHHDRFWSTPVSVDINKDFLKHLQATLTVLSLAVSSI